jgi:hypothetical protein
MKDTIVVKESAALAYGAGFATALFLPGNRRRSRPAARMAMLVLGMAFCLEAAAEPSDKPLDIGVDVGYTYDDNVTRARDATDKRSDQSLSLNVSKAHVIPVNEFSQVMLNGFIGGEAFHSYNGLGRFFAGVQGEFQYRPSRDFLAPTFAAFVRTSAEQFQSTIRKGSRYSAGISVRQPVTDRINLFGALAHNVRRAKSRVFEGRENSARLRLDYSTPSAGTFYLGADYRRGDTVSTGRATLENLDIAKVFVLDDVFTADQMFSYRFEARTVLATLGYNFRVGPTDLLDFSWRRAEATPTLKPDFPGAEKASYVDNLFSIVYRLRF